MNKVWLLPEDELLQRVKMEDKEALHYLYKANFPTVMHLIKTNNGSEDDARDIYQEAFIVLLENLSKPDFELSCRVQTYLYSISRKKWLRHLAGRGRFSSIDESEEFPVENDEEENERQMESMADALEKLGEPCKGLIEGFYYQKLSMQEISARFGYTNADNAKNQKYKCLNRLRKLFFEKYKETV